MSGLKLFHTMNGNVAEVAPRLAEVEADVQHLIEAHMETMLGVRFLASEYSTGPVHGSTRWVWTRTTRRWWSSTSAARMRA
ncbi:transporter [Streptomyces paromomycinus]|uniref:Transporter n=1 Tax=Streptomyces paromomycinus TaxID=92743 RepID=A0A401VXV0_STREY|nr:transporter [Streptomyces paromomycinus]